MIFTVLFILDIGDFGFILDLKRFVLVCYPIIYRNFFIVTTLIVTVLFLRLSLTIRIVIGRGSIGILNSLGTIGRIRI